MFIFDVVHIVSGGNDTISERHIDFNHANCINNCRRIGGGKRQKCYSIHNVDEQAT